MDKYKSLTRTTLAECADLPHSGIYIIAYMGRVLYVGKANDSIADRLASHLLNRGLERLGYWMECMRWDWCNVRLDCLETPDVHNQEVWIRDAESALVRRLSPLFNSMLVE